MLGELRAEETSRNFAAIEFSHLPDGLAKRAFLVLQRGFQFAILSVDLSAHCRRSVLFAAPQRAKSLAANC